MRFVDTSILLYAISREPAERSKAEVASRLLCSRDLALSAQVLQEFYVQATDTDRSDRLTHEQALGLVESFRRFPIQETTVGLALAATDLSRRFQISYRDAAVVEAARLLECDVLLSADLPHRQTYGDVLVVDPLAGY